MLSGGPGPTQFVSVVNRSSTFRDNPRLSTNWGFVRGYITVLTRLSTEQDTRQQRYASVNTVPDCFDHPDDERGKQETNEPVNEDQTGYCDNKYLELQKTVKSSMTITFHRQKRKKNYPLFSCSSAFIRCSRLRIDWWRDCKVPTLSDFCDCSVFIASRWANCRASSHSLIESTRESM